jgi:hypothetical protein
MKANPIRQNENAIAQIRIGFPSFVSQSSLCAVMPHRHFSLKLFSWAIGNEIGTGFYFHL